MKLLKNIIPDIEHLLSPILDSANSIPTTMDYDSLKQTSTSTDSFWNSMLYMNGCTSGLHTERYCTYTLITVTKKIFKIRGKTLMHKPMFIFKLKDKQ